MGEDVPFLEKELQSANRTLTKLWNASRFTLMNLSDYRDDWTGRFDELEVIDRWILSRLNKLVAECTESFASYEHNKAKLAVEQFFWSDFCDNYLEIVKGRLYEPKDAMQKRSAQFALTHVLSAILKLFAPFMPFVTEEIYQLRFARAEGKKSIHVAAWPEVRKDWKDEQAEIIGSQVTQVLDAVRKHKTGKQLAMNAPLERVTITTKLDLTMAENDILSVTKASQISLRAPDEDEFAVQVE
jgi:valyl-tRNA synthetase